KLLLYLFVICIQNSVRGRSCICCNLFYNSYFVYFHFIVISCICERKKRRNGEMDNKKKGKQENNEKRHSVNGSGQGSRGPGTAQNLHRLAIKCLKQPFCMCIIFCVLPKACLPLSYGQGFKISLSLSL